MLRKCRVLRTNIDSTLNTLQKQAQDRATNGESLLVMGAAGTGKSHVTRAIRAGLIKNNKYVACCAPFGVAACNVDGFTIHSTFGIGVDDLENYRKIQATAPGSTASTDLRRKITRASYSSRGALWDSMDTLMLDEISTCDSSTFEVLDYIAKIVKQNDKPFGGIQVIGIGDFLQLPPVNGHWAFHSDSYREVFGTSVIQLNEVLRQDDAAFLDTLNVIRILHPRDKLSRMIAIEQLKSTCRTTDPVPVDAVRLVPLRVMANRYNAKRLSELMTPLFNYHAYDTVTYIDESMAENINISNLTAMQSQEIESSLLQLLETCRLTPELSLRKGCRVMNLVNRPLREDITNKSSSESIVNGHTGVVVAFRIPKDHETNDFYREWAAHRREDGLDAMVPVVRWDHNKEKTLVLPTEVIVGSSYVTHARCRSRLQFPIGLAWAITAHKCQGMTIQGNVSVSLRSTFAPGQGYVSLSRGKSGNNTYIDGLENVTEGLCASPEALRYLGYPIPEVFSNFG